MKSSKVVRAGVERFEHRCDGRPVLADESRAGRNRAVHADAGLVGPVPLSPAVVFGRLRRRSEVDVDDIGQRADAQRTGVALIDRPRTHQHVDDRLHNGRIVAERQSRPLLGNLFAG